MKFNGFYVLVVFLGLFLIWLTAGFFGTSSNCLPAVAVSKEMTIRSEHQAAVTAVRVSPGQQIKAGDTLIRLSSVALSQDFERVARRLSSLRTEQAARQSALRLSIDLSRNDINLNINRLQESINQATRELELNARLTGNSQASLNESPLAIRVSDLKSQVVLYQTRLRQREAELRSAYEAESAILQIQLDASLLEMEDVRRAQAGLIKVADQSGVIAQVMIRPGIVVDAFTPLATVLPSAPSMVVAYQQTEGSGFVPGTAVEVIPFTGIGPTVAGKITGTGSIVPLPEILQKSTAVKAFGKEIFVEVPSGNALTSGQKLLIRPITQ